MNDALPLTPAAQIIGGLLVLFLGRRLFWLFVGMVGFFCGLQFGLKMFADIADWLLLLLSVVTGLICAGLTIVLQRLTVIIAGGFVGGMLAIRLAPMADLHSDTSLWAAFIAGALLAAVLLYVIYDPVLILLSAAVGAMMIAEATSLDPMIQPLVLILFFIAGAVVQFRSYSRSRVAAI